MIKSNCLSTSPAPYHLLVRWSWSPSRVSVFPWVFLRINQDDTWKSLFLGGIFFYWSSICQHIAYHPVLILSSAPLSACHLVTPSPCPPPLPLPLVRFPELGVSHGLSSSLIFNTHFQESDFLDRTHEGGFSSICRGLWDVIYLSELVLSKESWSFIPL